VFWVAKIRGRIPLGRLGIDGTIKIRGRIPLGRLGIDGTIKIEMDLQEWFGGMDLIHVAQDRDQ